MNGAAPEVGSRHLETKQNKDGNKKKQKNGKWRIKDRKEKKEENLLQKESGNKLLDAIRRERYEEKLSSPLSYNFPSTSSNTLDTPFFIVDLLLFCFLSCSFFFLLFYFQVFFICISFVQRSGLRILTQSFFFKLNFRCSSIGGNRRHFHHLSSDLIN